MEKQLFDWDGWDVIDTMCFAFYDVVLRQSLGDYEIGRTFGLANLDLSKGILELYTNTGDREPAATFKLELKVVR